MPGSVYSYHGYRGCMSASRAQPRQPSALISGSWAESLASSRSHKAGLEVRRSGRGGAQRALPALAH